MVTKNMRSGADNKHEAAEAPAGSVVIFRGVDGTEWNVDRDGSQSVEEQQPVNQRSTRRMASEPRGSKCRRGVGLLGVSGQASWSSEAGTTVMSQVAGDLRGASGERFGADSTGCQALERRA